MADNDKKESAANAAMEVARTGGQNFVRLLTWIVPLIILGVVLYMLFVGSDPRREYKDPASTLKGYTDATAAYVGPTAQLPDDSAIDQILSFYDDRSRDFFRNNVPVLAEINTLGKPDPAGEKENLYATLTDRGKRAQAMLCLLRFQPLNGFAERGGVADIKESRNDSATRVQLKVVSRDLKPATIFMTKSEGLWYIADLGGAEPAIQERIDEYRKANPAKPGTN